MDGAILHYLAGIIDGEGTISLNEKTKRLQVKVAMIDPKPISIFCELFGLNQYSRILPSKKSLYIFDVSGTHAYFFLRVFVNRLIVKRKKAKYCIDWFLKTYPFYKKLSENFSM